LSPSNAHQKSCQLQVTGHRNPPAPRHLFLRLFDEPLNSQSSAEGPPLLPALLPLEDEGGGGRYSSTHLASPRRLPSAMAFLNSVSVPTGLPATDSTWLPTAIPCARASDAGATEVTAKLPLRPRPMIRGLVRFKVIARVSLEMFNFGAVAITSSFESNPSLFRSMLLNRSSRLICRKGKHKVTPRDTKKERARLCFLCSSKVILSGTLVSKRRDFCATYFTARRDRLKLVKGALGCH